MDTKKRVRIGELLIENKCISTQQLELALIEQKKTRRKLCKTLIDLGYIEEDTLLELLSKQLGIAHLNLKHYPINEAIFHALPEIFARRFRAIALTEDRGKILIGMTDPNDIFAFDEIQRVLKCPIEAAIISERDLLYHLDLRYRPTEHSDSIDKKLPAPDYDLQTLSQSSNAIEAPIARLLQTLFNDAISKQASGIHLETNDKQLRIRQRIDGVLYEQTIDEAQPTAALIARLKWMAGLSLSEKHLPQEGQFNLRVIDKDLDVRLATMPMVQGESIVMHLLEHSQTQLHFDRLGMPETILSAFKQLIKQPHGLILVTGPTDSGKATTLYTALNALNQATSKIIAVEDQLEYQLTGINQIQVQDNVSLTYPAALRAALKQDPDIILIGEMQDIESTNIGLRAAMTGRLVLSTLPTHDAISGVSRLLDMATESFVLASSLKAVLSQRFIRRLCLDCRLPHKLSEHDEIWVQKIIGDTPQPTTFHQQQGCKQCNDTGYKGRTSVYELLVMTPNLLTCLQQNDNTAFVTQAKQQHFKNLTHNALELAMQGITTLDEVMRIADEPEIFPFYQNTHHAQS